MRYTFNQYLLDTERFELREDGILVHVEPQVVELLSLLIKKRDRMVSKEEINEVVWRGRIVSEAALSSRIKMARQVLGDDGRKQAVIRTIHRKGFRFVADVEEEQTSQSLEIKSSPGETTANGEGSERKRSGISKPSVAVLPFSNLSNDADQEYFSDGIGSDIIDRLSKHRWLNVTARNTTFGYKGKTIDCELRLDLLVEDLIIVKLKAVETMIPLFQAQLLTYLKLLKKPKGLLINFYSENITKSLIPLVTKEFSKLPIE